MTKMSTLYNGSVAEVDQLIVVIIMSTIIMKTITIMMIMKKCPPC